MKRSQGSQLERLYSFYLTGQHQSMKTAAEMQNVTINTISTKISALQRMLGYKIIDTQRRPIKLTDQGLVLFNSIKHGYESLSPVLRSVNGSECVSENSTPKQKGE